MFIHGGLDFFTDGVIDITITEKFMRREGNMYIPCYSYHISLHKKKIVIGTVDLRIGYHDNFLYGGQLGYEINESYRGNGYAARACLLIMHVARAYEMSEVYISCNPYNVASRKTCENIGASLKDIVLIPPTHELYQRGERCACLYVLKI